MIGCTECGAVQETFTQRGALPAVTAGASGFVGPSSFASATVTSMLSVRPLGSLAVTVT